MAKAISKEEDSFRCPVCLDLLKDPVAVPCGHNFCMSCINSCWDQEDQKGVYSCPLCKHTFTPRPVLYKNPLIAEMVEKFGRTPIQSVIEAPGQPQERICSLHDKDIDIFCRTDQSGICSLCAMDKHEGHDIVTAVEERTDKQKELGETQRRFQQRIQERKKELQELRQAVETLKSSAQAAVEETERIFTEMIRSLERRRSEVTQLIRGQEKVEVSRAEGVLKRLEQEIAELKRRDAELEQLSHTQDHIHFLKSFQSIRDSPYSRDVPSMTFNQNISFDGVRKSVSTLKMQLQKQLEGIFKQEGADIPAAVTDVQIACPESKIREEFLQYSFRFTLDPNTAHRCLLLSEGNRRVEWRDKLQSYPDHPERFDLWEQVLCREGVSGRCYWEVEWSNGVYIAVSYKSIDRKERNANRLGWNDQSWSLSVCGSTSYYYHENSIGTKLPLVASSRIGVYVDHRAGTLAFYNVSHTGHMTLLHSVQTTFTDTLYPGFWLSNASSVNLL